MKIFISPTYDTASTLDEIEGGIVITLDGEDVSVHVGNKVAYIKTSDLAKVLKIIQ